jgi:hypothetical protein
MVFLDGLFSSSRVANAGGDGLEDGDGDTLIRIAFGA